ncbi:SNF2-related protein [Anaerobiospirillum succiniciproducens]|uniref:SNF2-related protein n=1 Tax=Anaerobiospirillum succiniciproducens TaxID=13335 RepID=UPI003F887B93
MTPTNNYLPGNLVCARDRTWVVQNGSTDDWLKLRPLSGAEDEVVELDPALEFEPVKLASFAAPDPSKSGQYNCAKLLYDALRFQLRSGAGPFRSFASVSFEPRAYQLVPLMMALRMKTVRLLIADDVGIGKTIEAGLIVRELLDRGEISSLAVLCPPHLVDQWIDELERHFNIHAEALTSASAVRLEKRVPHGKKLTEVFPFLVVSLDYIKSERHREYFQTVAPEFIIVDEAHTCTLATGTKQLRFELLKRLASEETRHMLLLTATPHSGNEDAFYNLLSLLDQRFESFKGRKVPANDRLRRELAKYYIQRRRQDIKEWQELSKQRIDGFPLRLSADLKYDLNADWQKFFDAVLDYCHNLVTKIENENNESGQIIWYAVLALLRCVSSSPESAKVALMHRLENISNESYEDRIANELGDGNEDYSDTIDTNPGARIEDTRELKSLVKMADNLCKQDKDPKFKILALHVKKLLDEGFYPVIFCRYVATAEYVARELQNKFKKVAVGCVTGALVPEERQERVEELGTQEKRILVATDCLSEGINLQHHFNAVVHYDLAWNPTRHEQREGRVDRFGQQAPEVRCSMIYSENNPVDALILKVIFEKSKKIKDSIGVTVPVPTDNLNLQESLIKETLMKRQGPVQEKLFDLDDPAWTQIDENWTNALEKVKAIKSLFTHSAMHPDEVYEYWKQETNALGSHEDLQFFCNQAASLLGCHLEPNASNPNLFSVPVNTFKDKTLVLRLEDEGIKDGAVLNFNELHRASPFVSLLAESFVEAAISGSDESAIARCAVTTSDNVDAVTSIYLLRMRYQMFIRYRNELKRCLLAEEILPVSVAGVKNLKWSSGHELVELINDKSRSNLTAALSQKMLTKSIDTFNDHKDEIERIASERAQALLEEHTQVKEYTEGGSVTEVKVCHPIDLMGVFVLMPNEE